MAYKNVLYKINRSFERFLIGVTDKWRKHQLLYIQEYVMHTKIRTKFFLRLKNTIFLGMLLLDSYGFREGGRPFPYLRDSPPADSKSPPLYYFEISIFG